MGTITIHIKDEVEKEFRNTVKSKIGEGKGRLGSAVEEALKEWIEEKQSNDSKEKLKQKLKTGLYKLEKNWKFNRDEIYDRF